MDSSKPKPFILRSTSTVSLNERFSKVLTDPPTNPRVVTFDPLLLQEVRGGDRSRLILLDRKKSIPVCLQACFSSARMRQQAKRRRSVWTRLNWQPLIQRLSTRKPRGFWSFRNKYRWRARIKSAHRSGRNLRGRLEQRCFLNKRNIQDMTAGHSQLNMHRQGRFRGQRSNNGRVRTKRQLDAELDKYMSLSKRRLDEQLDKYMSMSKSRLDAELDEYMAMAGQMDWE